MKALRLCNTVECLLNCQIQHEIRTKVTFPGYEMLLIGDLKIIVIIKGMSNQVIRYSITLILQFTCVQLQHFLLILTSVMFQRLIYSFISLCGQITITCRSLSSVLFLAFRSCPIYKQKRWVFGSMQLNYNPAS